MLKSLADAFNLSAETVLGQAGLLDEEPAAGDRAPLDAEAAIRADPRLTESQKEALLAVYQGFTARGPSPEL